MKLYKRKAYADYNTKVQRYYLNTGEAWYIFELRTSQRERFPHVDMRVAESTPTQPVDNAGGSSAVYNTERGIHAWFTQTVEYLLVQHKPTVERFYRMLVASKVSGVDRYEYGGSNAYRN